MWGGGESKNVPGVQIFHFRVFADHFRVTIQMIHSIGRDSKLNFRCTVTKNFILDSVIHHHLNGMNLLSQYILIDTICTKSTVGR